MTPCSHQFKAGIPAQRVKESFQQAFVKSDANLSYAFLSFTEKKETNRSVASFPFYSTTSNSLLHEVLKRKQEHGLPLLHVIGQGQLLTIHFK